MRHIRLFEDHKLEKTRDELDAFARYGKWEDVALLYSDFVRTYHKNDKSKLGLSPDKMREVLADFVEKATETQVKDMAETCEEIGDMEIQESDGTDKGQKILYTLKTKAKDNHGKEHTVHILQGKKLKDDKYDGKTLSISGTPGQWYLDTLLADDRDITRDLSIYGNDWILKNQFDVLTEVLEFIKNEGPVKESLNEGEQKRPISEIAKEAIEDMKKQSPNGNWRRKFAAAEAYLTPMLELDKITDKYYEDSASGIVAYFLGNAQQWRGEVAKRIKAELKEMIK